MREVQELRKGGKVIGLIPEKQDSGRCKSSMVALLVVTICSFLMSQSVLAYEEESDLKGGTLSGIVTFSGKVPPPETFKVTMGSNPEFCQSLADEKGMIHVPSARVSSKGELADVVVFLQEVERGKPLAKQPAVVTIDQCRFKPPTVGAMTESTLRVAMQDPVIHQIRGWEVLEKGRLPLFHLPNLGEGGEATIPLKARRSSIVKLECDQHRFMQGWMLLTANPYVTVTDQTGAWHLTDVPAGKLTVGAWHPVLGYQEGLITVRSGQQATIDLHFGSSP